MKTDFTFTADRPLPHTRPKFLDNCFITGFTHFPVAVLTSSEEGVISEKLLDSGEKRAGFSGHAWPWTAPASCSINRRWFCGSQAWVCGDCWDDGCPRMRRTTPASPGAGRSEHRVHTTVDNSKGWGPAPLMPEFRHRGQSDGAALWNGSYVLFFFFLQRVCVHTHTHTI